MGLESHEGGQAVMDDPTVTDPGLYRVVFENDRVRVLEYRDEPGAQTHPHDHPDSVMITLTSFHRRVSLGDQERDLEIPAARARWVGAQRHSGLNTGDSPTHAFFVELKEPAQNPSGAPVLGPS
ncbi:quercetin dioxygenase-like cupin family protein [Hamadaea flava]|uniref:Cytoplasmic protein n=1 Tax=Hamadaea flava TaxID=1742688 RepID=A0ABV8LQK9_9ACTN|nr:cytoplasmic protein [Hamadaea flava]MCP2322344.1 quercetin dioxygenase-like cupin family protein [Hamadaea flava]